MDTANPGLVLTISIILLAVAFRTAAAQQASSDGVESVPKYGVFETALTSDETFDNPFRDVEVVGRFTGPNGGEPLIAEGFYYGDSEWRVRFMPQQQGRWAYAVELAGPDGKVVERSGKFLCEGQTGHGPLRVSKRNRFRFEYADGTPFYPIGLQTGGYFRVGLDGPTADGKWRSVSAEQWCKEVQGGVNLVRWQLGAGTTEGCALPLIPVDGSPDRYDTELAMKMDALLKLQKAHGLSHIMVPLQDMSLWQDKPTAFGTTRQIEGYKSVKAENLPLQEQYLRYVVARFGCYVDIWEMFNEDLWAPNDYLAHLAGVIRQADPYDHIVTTSYPRPGEDWCEIICRHRYFRIPANGVDVYLASQIGRMKSYGKIVQYTEGGNKGWMSNYDPVKWRVAYWTAFMNESGMLLWSMSGRKTDPRAKRGGGNANAYIGPETRQAFRVLNEFTRDLPIDMRPIESAHSEEHEKIRTYGLSNGKVTVLYVHHYVDHTQPFSTNTRLMVDTGPGKFAAKWMNPADGKEMPSDQGEQVGQLLRLPMPRFKIDAVCRIDRID